MEPILGIPKKRLAVAIIVLLLAMNSSVWSSDVNIPYTFVAGQTAVADEVNANFSVVQTAVDDNTVCGGFGNRTSGDYSSVSGGQRTRVAGEYDWAAGTLFEEE